MNSKNCQQCNKEFTKKVNTSKKEWSTSKFCSHKCGYLNRGIGKKIYNCKICKVDFSGKYRNPTYCSKKCKNRDWRGGVDTRVTKSIRSSSQHTKWRSDILTRDNWTCQTCGVKEAKLEVHHIKSLALIVIEEKIEYTNMINKKSQLWDINNGVTLCKSCHKMTDSYMKSIKNQVKFA